MADTKLSALTADASPSSTDVVKTAKDPGGTPLSRKVTIADLVAAGIEAVLTTRGDMLYRDASGAARLAVSVTAGAALTSNGTDPAWEVPVYADVMLKADFPCANATLTNVLFNTTYGSENEDSDSLHDMSVNPQRFTVPTGGGGLYSVVASILWESHATAGRRFYVYSGAASRFRAITGSWASGSYAQNGTLGVERLAAAGYIKILVVQYSGGSLNLLFGQAGSTSTGLSIRRVVVE